MKTLKNYFTQVYSSVRYKSKRNWGIYPEFTKDQLIKWLYSNGIEKKWITYIESGYNKDYKPSIDRIDPFKEYCFDNMQLITWKENLIKGVNSIKHDIMCNQKHARKPVYLIGLNGSKKFFKSVDACAWWLGAHKVSVSRALTGSRKSIHGYKVKYASEKEWDRNISGKELTKQ